MFLKIKLKHIAHYSRIFIESRVMSSADDDDGGGSGGGGYI